MQIWKSKILENTYVCIDIPIPNTRKKIFFTGLIWSEIKQLWDVGLREYITDMWNVVDFVTNALYVATIALRLVAYYRVCDSTDYPVHLVDSLLLLLLHVVGVVTRNLFRKKIGYSVSITRSKVLIDNYYTISQVYFWVGRKSDYFFLFRF